MAKKKSDKEIELMLEMRQLAREANKRLQKVESQFGKDTWASRNLRQRLEAEKVQAFTKSGRVSMSGNMSIPKMRATINATKQFLNSKTSTVEGIKETREVVKNAMSTSADISYSTADIIQRIWEDKAITKLPKYIKGSDFINFIGTAVDRDREVKQQLYQYEDETDEDYKKRVEQARQNEFMQSLNEYINSPDSDGELKEEAKRILEKYFS